MTDQEERTRDLYAISLGIGPEETFQRTVQGGLAAYLDRLPCDVGAVLERSDRENGTVAYDLVGSVPTEPHTAESFSAGVAETVLDRIPAVLDQPLSAIWEYDRGQEAFVPCPY